MSKYISGIRNSNISIPPSGNITTTNTVSSFSNGSAGNPSITFTSDLNTGIYRINEDIIGFSTNGTERIRITDTGITSSGLITGSSGLTISAGTSALQALTCTTINASGTSTLAAVNATTGSFTTLSTSGLYTANAGITVATGNISITSTTGYSVRHGSTNGSLTAYNASLNNSQFLIAGAYTPSTTDHSAQLVLMNNTVQNGGPAGGIIFAGTLTNQSNYSAAGRIRANLNSSGAYAGALIFETLEPNTGTLFQAMTIDSAGNLSVTGGITGNNGLAITGVKSDTNSSAGVYIGRNSGNQDYSIEMCAGAGSTYSYIDFTQPNVDLKGRIQYENSINSMQFYTDGGIRMIISSTGNVGIGTGTPRGPLQIGTADGDKIIFAEGGGIAGSKIAHLSGWGLGYYTGRSAQNDGGYHAFYTSSGSGYIENVRITSNGNVGIGTDRNESRLHVVGATNTGVMKICNNTSNGGDQWWLGFCHGVVGTDGNDRARIYCDILAGGAGRLLFTTGTAGGQVERMRIDESGNVTVSSNIRINSKITSVGTMLNSSATATSTPIFSNIKSINERLRTPRVNAIRCLNTWNSRTTVNNIIIGSAWSSDLGIFVLTGNSTLVVYSSTDGITWTTSATVGGSMRSVIWVPELSLFVGVSLSGTIGSYTSNNGTTWSAANTSGLTGANSLRSVCYSPELNLFVTVGSTSAPASFIATSTNGTSWSPQTSPSASTLLISVCWSPELMLFVAVANTGSNSSIITSSNGINWSTINTTSYNTIAWRYIAWSPELHMFVAVNNTNATTVYSLDGVTWTTNTALSNATFIIWVPELSMFISSNDSNTTNLYYSYNGINWFSKSVLPSGNYYTMCFSPELSFFVTHPAGNNAIRTSDIALPNSRSALLTNPSYMSVNNSTGTVTISNSTNTTNLETLQLSNSNTADPLFRLIATKGTTTNTNGDVIVRLGLHYSTTDANSFIRFHRGASQTGGFMSFTTNNDTERMRIDTSGLITCYNGLTVSSGNVQIQSTAVLELGTGISKEVSAGKIGYQTFSGDALDIVGAGTVAGRRKVVLYDNVETGGSMNFVYRLNSSGTLLNTSSSNGNSYRSYSQYVMRKLKTSNANAINCVTNWYSRTITSGNWTAICWSPELGIFVAVGAASSYVATSPDGINWTGRSSPASRTWSSVCWSAEIGRFVAVGQNADTNIMYSSDGTNWTGIVGITTTLVSVVWSPELGRFVAMGSTSTVRYSSDGISWSTSTKSAGAYLAWSPELSLFVAIDSTAPNISTSSDGITWTTGSITDDVYTDICWSPELGLFAAASAFGRVYTSNNGFNWVLRTGTLPPNFQTICWSPELSIFVVMGSTTGTNKTYSSPDGITWTARSTANATSVCWSPELSVFCSTYSTSTCYTSAIGIPNSKSTILTNPAFISTDSSNNLEFGKGVAGKETNAGKIGYQGFTSGMLDIIGAGTSSGGRKVKLWDDVVVQQHLYVQSANTTGANGAIQVTAVGNSGIAQDGAAFKASVDANNIINFVNSSGTGRGNIGGVDANNIAYRTNSDIRLKTNIIEMNNEEIMQKIVRLKPSTYTWKSDKADGFGFIAQEVYKVFPELRPNIESYVDVNAENYDIEYPIDRNGKEYHYSLDYGRFTPYLTASVKYLYQKNIELTNHINKLEEFIKSKFNDFE